MNGLSMRSSFAASCLFMRFPPDVVPSSKEGHFTTVERSPGTKRRYLNPGLRPPAHDEALQHANKQEEGQRQGGNDENRRDDQVRPERVPHQDEEDAEATLSAGPFCDNSANNGVRNRDPEPGEEVRQRMRDFQQAE